MSTVNELVAYLASVSTSFGMSAKIFTNKCIMSRYALKIFDILRVMFRKGSTGTYTPDVQREEMNSMIFVEFHKILIQASSNVF